MANPLKIVTNGIFKENPIFGLVLGMCPTLAVTTSAENGLSMGLAAAAVLMGSNAAISALRRKIFLSRRSCKTQHLFPIITFF